MAIEVQRVNNLWVEQICVNSDEQSLSSGEYKDVRVYFRIGRQ